MFTKIFDWFSGHVFNNFAGPIVRRLVAGAAAFLAGIIALDPETIERWAQDTTTIVMALAAVGSSLALSWFDKFRKD